MSDSEHQATFRAPIIEEVETLFPAYEIHALIACGGMGAVYQATQRSLERAVAIKILPREFSSDEAFRTGFESEAKAMAKLNHPNLIGVYDFGEAGGMLYIIMEYVAGKSLFHSAHGYAVEQSEALHIVADVCHGLAHAHEHGVLHRDIKPANILLDAHTHPKIGDFGLARALEREIQEGEQIFGTPGYTAPEVIEPPYAIDHRADIFSVGVMLHELLTGKLPDADPRPASHICKCNARLDAVIRKATHPDPNARYFTATEMATELEKISSSPARSMLTAGSAAAVARPYVPPKKLPQKSSSGLGFLIVLVVIAAVIALFAMSRKAPPQIELEADTTEAPVKPPPKVINLTPPVQPILDPPPVLTGFDVPGYLSRARSNLRQRLAPTLEAHSKELSANTRELGTALSNAIRSDDRRAEALEQAKAAWKADRDRISDELPDSLASILGAIDLHSDYLNKQKTFQSRINGEMTTHSGIYILEIENQIGKLDEDMNKAAIEALEKEVELTKDDPEYFRELVLK